MDELLKLWKWLTEHEYKVEWYYEKLHRSHSEDEIVYRKYNTAPEGGRE